MRFGAGMMMMMMPVERDYCSQISYFACLSLLPSVALLAHPIPKHCIAVAGVCGIAFIRMVV